MKQIFKITLLLIAFSVISTGVTLAHDIGVNTKVSKTEISKSIDVLNIVMPTTLLVEPVIINSFSLAPIDHSNKLVQIIQFSIKESATASMSNRIHKPVDSYRFSYRSYKYIMPKNTLPVKFC